MPTHTLMADLTHSVWSRDLARWSFTQLQAYLLCSVAMDLRLAQVVNRPMTTVAASIPKHILLPARALF